MDDFILVAVKLLIGFLALISVINITGKGNLAPSSASDQVQNYVFGGIIGGVIYNKDVKILEYIGVLCIWCVLVLFFKFLKAHNVEVKQILDGKAYIIINDGVIILRTVNMLASVHTTYLSSFVLKMFIQPKKLSEPSLNKMVSLLLYIRGKKIQNSHSLQTASFTQMS